MPKLRAHQLDPSDGGPGDVPTIGPAGTQVTWGSGGGREVLMATGVTSPPEPLESSDGADWLYGRAG